MTTAQILERIRNLRVLVVGDICLDRWLRYDPEEAEPSRETGIPRIGVVRGEVTPGAAGTVVNNLIALGVGHVSIAGVVGDDGHGFELRRALEQRGIATDSIVVAPGVQTFTYTKLINSRTGEEDLPRVDFINVTPMDPAVEKQINDIVLCRLDGFDAVIISDQAETARGGVVSAGIRDLLSDVAPEYPEKTFLVDSRRRIEKFRNVILKPNQQEAEEACRRLFGRVDYPALQKHTAAPFLVVTHGGDGVLLVSDAGEQWQPARKIENPVDICGAGDSFSAGMATALAVTGSAVEAARFGNLVASITIMKKGTGTASPEELLEADTGN